MRYVLLFFLVITTLSAYGQCGDCPSGLFPFCHGVASGDPWPNSVILWTRVTPEESEAGTDITIEWEVASDPDMINTLQTGTTTTNDDRDYTLKFELENLDPNTTYYYRFHKNGIPSATGRTRTAPDGDIDKLRIAVATCSRYNSGYFNGYSRIADRNDLAAVLFLGDYIYESGSGDDGIPERAEVFPSSEILTLEDYRCRYAFYRLDHDLFRVHQQHPAICIWDDHEIVNNAWEFGAANHDDATEGDYAERKAAARQAYFEWLPIREDPSLATQKVYRKFNYGNLADIIMLDTRHEGRDMQTDTTDVDFYAPDRTILGDTQREWFLDALESSTAKWKVIGNQVAFSPLNTLDLLDNFDAWDGYPAEREKIVGFIDSLGIDDVVFMTGDLHIGLAGDITLMPEVPYDPETGEGYDQNTGNGAVAVECVSPSITSHNLDDVDIELPIPLESLPEFALLLNPHGKFVDFSNHGYVVLDLDDQRAQSDWYWVTTKYEPTSEEFQAESWYTLAGDNFLQLADNPAPSLADAPEPAPEFPLTGLEELTLKENISLKILPNPASELQVIAYTLTTSGNVSVDLINGTGQLVQRIFSGHQTKGTYQFQQAVSTLPTGIYYYKVMVEGEPYLEKVIVE